MKKKDASSVETLTKEDAMWFPVQAGVVLVGLYALIKYFGKEVVNYLLMAYMGLSFGVLIEDFLLPLASSYKFLKPVTLFKLKFQPLSLD